MKNPKHVLLAVVVMSLSITACSDEDSKNTSPPTKVSGPPAQSTETKTPTGNGTRGNLTRGDSETVRSSFAGFGRVGRSHYSHIDYRARWAIIVGLNRFKDESHLSKLGNAVNDATAVRNMLRDEFGYDDDRIIFLADQEKDATGTLVDKDPVDKADVLRAFDDLASRDIRPSDAVVFFFAGHGKSDANGTYLAAYDAVSEDLTTWVDAVALKERLRLLPARHKLIILDSCYAGSILDVTAPKQKEQANPPVSATPVETVALVPRTRSEKKDTNNDDEAYAIRLNDNISYYLQQPAFFAITSGRDQPVGDASKVRPEHSPFTAAFLDVLQERANSSREGDVFTVRELAVRVESRVRTGQTPDWGRLEGSRGDFVFKPTRDRFTPREIAERDDYAVRIGLAEAAIERGNINYAMTLLEACPKHLRHFEWYHLVASKDQSLKTMSLRHRYENGTNAYVSCSAFIPKRNHMVTGGGDGLIKVWDMAADGKLLFSLQAHQLGVQALAISHDGAKILSGGRDGVIKIWDANKGGEALLKLSAHSKDKDILLLAACDGGFVSASADRSIKVWKLSDGAKPLAVIPTQSYCTAIEVVSGQLILLGDASGHVIGWPMQQTRVPVLSLFAHRDRVNAVASFQAGDAIVSGGSDGRIKIWTEDSFEKGEPKMILQGHTGFITSLAIAGRRIFAASSDKSINVWNPDVGDEALLTLRGHDQLIKFLTVAPDGNQVISGDSWGTFKIWAADSGGRAVKTIRDHPYGVQAAAISPDGKRIASGNAAGTILLSDANSGKVIHTMIFHEKNVNSIVFSSDGKQIVSGSGDHAVCIWDVESGKLVKTLRGHTGSVRHVGISPGKELVLSGSDDGATAVWDAAGNPQVLTEDGSSAVAMSADGKRIVTAGKEGITIWDVATQDAHSFGGDQTEVSLLAISADGKRVVSAARQISVWDADGGDEPLLILRGHDGPAASLVISPDGKRIVSGGNDKTIRVWDAERGGVPLLTLRGHKGFVGAVGISADGKRIVSGSWDKTVKIWNTADWLK